jgi:hypothetical protein
MHSPIARITILIPILLVLFVAATGQQTPVISAVFTKTDYLKKSKKQKTVAWVLLGGGATLVLTGIIIPKGEITNPDCVFCPEEKIEYKNDGIKSTLGLTGVLSMIGSIPFFIASSKNKKKAMSISFKNELSPPLVKSSFVYRSVPSLNLKISL